MSIHEYLNNEAHFVPLGLNNDSPRWRGVRAPLGNTRENPRLGQQSRLIRIPTPRAAFWRFDLEDPHPRAGQPPLGPPRSGRPSGRPPPATGTAVATPAPASPPPVANATSKLFPSKKNAHQRGKAKGFGGRRGVTLRRGGSASRPLPPSGSVGRRHRCSCPYRASPPALPPPKKINIELRKKTFAIIYAFRVLRSCGSTSDRRHASPL